MRFYQTSAVPKTTINLLECNSSSINAADRSFRKLRSEITNAFNNYQNNIRFRVRIAKNINKHIKSFT